MQPPDHHSRLALFVIATAQLMVALAATIVNVGTGAQARIQRALGFSGSLRRKRQQQGPQHDQLPEAA